MGATRRCQSVATRNQHHDLCGDQCHHRRLCDADGNANSYSYGYSCAYTDGNPNSYSDTYADSNANSHGYGDRDGDHTAASNADDHAQAYADPEAGTDASSSGVSGMFQGGKLASRPALFPRLKWIAVHASCLRQDKLASVRIALLTLGTWGANPVRTSKIEK